MESNVAELPLSHRLWAWFEANQKTALYLVGLAVVVGIIVGFLLWRRGQQKLAAGNAVSNVAYEQLTAAPGTAPDVAAAYLKVAQDYPNSMAGARAVLLAAANLYSNSKYADAQKQFERFSREYHDSPFLGEALLGVGTCLAAEGKTDQAVSALKDLITRHPNDYVVPNAKFALARLYEQQNKPEQARDTYEEVARMSGFNSLGSEAGFRADDLNLKYPKPVPAPMTPTFTPGALTPIPGTNPGATITPAPTTPPAATGPSVPAAPATNLTIPPQPGKK